MLWKYCTQHASKFGKLSSGHRTGKGQFSFQSQRMLKLLHITLISHVSKVMHKILQARLQQYVNQELPEVQAGSRKGRGTRDQIANLHWITEKAREFQEKIYFCFIDCVDHNKLWKILQEVGISDHLPAFWETCMWVKKQQWELDMEKGLVQTPERSTSRLYIVIPLS